MAKTVIKKDGRKEPFIKEKIVVSAVKSGAPVETARKIAEKIEKHPDESIKTQWIRKQVSDHLELHNPEWVHRFRSYDKNVKRLSKYKR
jgi:transcriptional regulator NrdR family protein